jgi:hypothetical protein
LQAILDQIGDVIEQLDPFNTGNQLIYYTWLVVYTFTWVAVWRSSRPWFRFFCFLVNQLFSIGILLSTVLTVAMAARYWQASLAVFAATAAISLFIFRRRY